MTEGINLKSANPSEYPDLTVNCRVIPNSEINAYLKTILNERKKMGTKTAPVLENVIIETAWGSKAVCLAGSYIVTYNASENDFNTVEKGAVASTYQITDSYNKTM